MDRKSWLSRGRDARNEITALLCTRDGLHALAELPGVEQKEMIQAIELEINGKVAELCSILEEIRCVVEGVGDIRYRMLLTERYVNFKTWEQVAESLGYDLRWVYRLHKEALSALEEQ